MRLEREANVNRHFVCIRYGVSIFWFNGENLHSLIVRSLSKVFTFKPTSEMQDGKKNDDKVLKKQFQVNWKKNSIQSLSREHIIRLYYKD